jgi:signal transduction histidine kinase
MAGLAIGISAVFGLFAMAFAYVVEDTWFERQLADEAAMLRSHWAQQGRWGVPKRDFISLYPTAATLPADLARVLRDEPERREAAGDDGRYYHLLHIQPGGPVLVAEVSRQLVVRPLRHELLAWLWGGAAAVLLLALGVAWWLARHLAAPLEHLAAQVALADPVDLPGPLSQGLADDEVGAVARKVDDLLTRVRDFVKREQAFAHDASHELRTPLSVLRLGIDRLLIEPSLSPSTSRQLQAMAASVEFMTQSVEALLLLAREDPTALTQEPVPVLPLAERWVVAHAVWLDVQAMSLALDLTPSDTLRLPPAVVQLVLGGLIGNALAHGAAGGSVRVDMDKERLRVRNPSGPLPAQAGRALVKGEGSPGLGLGLSILQRLLARHGGGLTISHDGSNTCVSVHDGGPAAPVRSP